MKPGTEAMTRSLNQALEMQKRLWTQAFGLYKQSLNLREQGGQQWRSQLEQWKKQITAQTQQQQERVRKSTVRSRGGAVVRTRDTSHRSPEARRAAVGAHSGTSGHPARAGDRASEPAGAARVPLRATGAGHPPESDDRAVEPSSGRVQANPANGPEVCRSGKSQCCTRTKNSGSQGPADFNEGGASGSGSFHAQSGDCTEEGFRNHG